MAVSEPIQPSAEDLKHGGMGTVSTMHCDGMQQKFSCLLSNIQQSLNSQNISSEAFLNTLLLVKMFDPSVSDESLELLADHKYDLKQAMSNAAIFEIIKPYMSFLNPELPAHIIEFLGSDDDRKNFKDYMKDLEEFCTVTQTVLSLQTGTLAAFKRMNVVANDVKTKDLKYNTLQSIKMTVAKVLKLNVTSLQIVSVNSSESSLSLSFIIPNAACNNLFPLSSKQNQELTVKKIVSLECGNHIFTNTQYQIGNDDETQLQNTPMELDQTSNFVISSDVQTQNTPNPTSSDLETWSRNAQVQPNQTRNQEQHTQASSDSETQHTQLQPNQWSDYLETSQATEKQPIQIRDDAQTQNDHSQSEQVKDLAEEEIEMPCLGRPFSLGMLYDCHRDNLIRGMKVCDNQLIEAAIEEMSCVANHGQTEHHSVILEDSWATKANYLGLSTSLKLSLISGLITDISGSARYWNDRVTSKEKIRVCVKLESTKCVKHLPIEKLKSMQQRSDVHASHVVTKIVYGLDAYFVIDHIAKERDTSGTQNVHDELANTLMKHFLEETPETVPSEILGKNTEYKVYSDGASLDNQTETFFDCIKKIKRLRRDHMFPKKAWLYPLTKLSNRQRTVARPVNVHIVDKIQFILEYLLDLENQVNDILSANESTCQKCYYLRERLYQFVESINKYKLTTSKHIRELLPQVRNGSIKEVELAKVIKEESTSPFDYEALSSWLKTQEDEICVVSFLLKKFEDLDFVSESEMESISKDYDHVVCFAFNTGLDTDQFLKQLKLYNELGVETHTSDDIKVCKPWYKDTDLMKRIYNQIERFKQFCKANEERTKVKFIVASNIPGSNSSCSEPASIVLYKDGEPKVWEPPGPPTQLKATLIPRKSTVKLKWSKPKYGCENIECYIISCLSNKNKLEKKWTNSAEEREMFFELSYVLANNTYLFYVQAQCKDGFAVSDESNTEYVKLPQMSLSTTKNNSTLSTPKVIETTHNSIELEWTPERRGVDGYSVFYSPSGISPYTWKRKYTENTRCCVDNLEENTSYVFKVRSELNGGGVGAESISDIIRTKPRPLSTTDFDVGQILPGSDSEMSEAIEDLPKAYCQPGMPKSTSVTQNSIMLEWDRPDFGSENVVHYEVHCYIKNGDTKGVLFETKAKHCCTEIKNLTSKSKYMFTVLPVVKSNEYIPAIKSPCSETIKTAATSAPTKLSANKSTITHESIDLQWVAPIHIDEEIEEYHIFYCKIDTQSDAQLINAEWKWKVKIAKEKKMSVTIDGLKPATNYLFKVRPKCKTGWFGTESRCTDPIQTKATSPPSKPVAILRDGATTHNSIHIYWTKPECGSEHVTSYIVNYHSAQESNKPSQSTSDTNVVVTGLKPGKAYYFTIQPKCRVGIGSKSEQSGPIPTKASSPPGKPVINLITHKLVELSWTKPEYGSENVRRYEVYVKKMSTDHWQHLHNCKPSESCCTIEDKKKFELFTEYVFQIRPECGKSGYGCQSEVSDKVRTSPTSAPKSLKTARITHNSIELNWSRPQRFVKNVTHYTIYYRESNSQEWSTCTITASTAQGSDSSVISQNITGLNSNTEYVFKVRPECAFGSGSESKVSNPVKTKPVCQCSTLQVSHVTHKDIVWEWSEPQHGKKNVLFYNVWYKKNDETTPWTPVSKHNLECFHKLSGLTPNTSYMLRVEPQCANLKGSIITKCSESDPISTKATSPPGKPVASNVTHDSILLEWDKPEEGSGNVSGYSVQCKELSSQDYTQFQNPCSEKIEITGLKPGIKYTFEVEPLCESGSGTISESSDPIQTIATSSPGKPQAIKITHNSITLEWTHPKHGRENVDVYKVCCNCSVEDSLTSELCKNSSITILHLKPKTKYKFKVSPKCKPGTGVGTDSEFSDMIETFPVCRPGKPTATDVTHNSMKLVWNKPEYGKIDFYSVTYWQDTSNSKSLEKHCVKALKEEVTLNDLHTNKNYCIEVAAKLLSNEKIVCEPSLGELIKTKATSEPGKPKACKKTDTAIELQWTKPAYGCENIEFYIVMHCPAIDSEQRWDKCPAPKLSDNFANSTHSLTVEQLQPKTSYIFKVHPECRHEGKGTDSYISDPITTACTSLPKDLNVSSVTHNTIMLEWTKPDYGSESISYYTVSYRKADEEAGSKWMVRITKADETDITIDGLNTLTKYFFKVCPECTDGEGAEYEHKYPIETKATSSPGKPTAINVTHKSLTLKWAKPEYGCDNFEQYAVHFYPKDTPEQTRTEQCTEEKIEICSLSANTTYIFTVLPACTYGVSTESPPSDPIKTHLCCQPGKVIATDMITHYSIQIQWDEPNHGKVESYLVNCYRVIDERMNEIAHKTVDSSKLCVEFRDLEPKSGYVFKVTPSLEPNTENIFIESSESDPIQTKNKPLAERMRLISEPIDTSTNPAIYSVPVKNVMTNEKQKIKKCRIGEPSTASVDEKILMLVGATGAGKTTLINGMTNYIFNVQWKDPFRFKLITDENPGKNEAHSQTSWVTAYTFYPVEGSRINYPLTIIDTPGFGDSEGIERDKRITKQIQHFVSIPEPHDINVIHGIGFVTQSSLARLTQPQRYIFDSIMAIFGKDIADNIYLMCTFCDGQKPPVLNAVKLAQVPGGDTLFKFNNSAVFATFDDSNPFDKMFWEMGEKSFEQFFTHFQNAPSQSLKMTKQVMGEREHLEIVIENLHQQIKLGFSKIDELQQEEKVLRDHQKDIDANKNFSYEVVVTKYKKVDLDEGKHVTNCLQCKLTCHADCTIEEDCEKYKCKAMGYFWEKTKDAHCKVCPGKCHWEHHVNRNYYYIPYEENETRTLEDLKAKYDEAVGGKSRVEQMIAQNEQELEELRNAVLDLLRQTKEIKERLSEIALKPNPLTEEAYIDILIASEQEAAETGFEKRIASLKMLKQKVKVLSKVDSVNSSEAMKKAGGKTWWQLWKEYSSNQ